VNLSSNVNKIKAHYTKLGNNVSTMSKLKDPFKKIHCLQDHTLAIHVLAALCYFNSRSAVAAPADDSETPVCCAKASERFFKLNISA
jgi:hypothetical protein